MDNTKLKEALKAKDCPLIYAADDNGIEISYKGSVKSILALVGTLMLSISNKSGMSLDSMYVDLICASNTTLKQYEELKERKAGKN